MIPLKTIRENPDFVREGASQKGENLNIDSIIEKDKVIRNMIGEVETLKAKRNTVTNEISELKRNKEDAEKLISEMKKLSDTIKEMDIGLSTNREELNKLLMWIPNLPHESVPVGKDETDNKIIREWGDTPDFDGSQKTHVELAESLDVIDFQRGAKISGSGFPLYKGMGAKLERALINFMLDFHVEKHGYTELYPPFMTNDASPTATGQLPKFAEDMYYVEKDELYLIPTAEVPVTNVHRDENIKHENLPIKYVAFSPCFRREAGSYGKETRGLLRVHQFNKVELVKFVEPSTSYDELESLTSEAEAVLQALGIKYRVVALCTGDLSFAAAKCYDLEIWAPGENRWLEVSSCSNFEAFQARRANIRYRNSEGKLDFVHTLNGSGVATARLMVALLETYQTDEGTVKIPEILVPYTGFGVLK